MNKKNNYKIKELDLEVQYKTYLQKMQLDETKMHPVQKLETKNAFMAGCGQTLVLMLEVIGAMKDEDRAVLHLEDLLNQANFYFEDLLRKPKSTIILRPKF